MSSKIIFISLFIGASLIMGSSLLIPLKSEILIESEESKTKEMTSVFNKIKWISLPDKDVWMMNQSHYGVQANQNKWERLAIVIDKAKSPYRAKYYQIENGPLEWSDDLVKKETPFRASCFTCHSNGPRAIRPASHSKLAPLGLKEKAQIFMLNMRIKTYGRIHYDSLHDKDDLTRTPPFHYSDEKEMSSLKVKTCTLCHKEDGFLSRGSLLFQQRGTIKSMVDKGHMPPPGFSLSQKEKKELRDFLRGF